MSETITLENKELVQAIGEYVRNNYKMTPLSVQFEIIRNFKFNKDNPDMGDIKVTIVTQGNRYP